MLSVEIDTNSFESTNLMVGTNMVTGSDNYLYVYPFGAPRPLQAKVESISGVDCLIGGVFHKTDLDGIPKAGKKYVVEADLIIFETGHSTTAHVGTVWQELQGSLAADVDPSCRIIYEPQTHPLPRAGFGWLFNGLRFDTIAAN